MKFNNSFIYSIVISGYSLFKYNFFLKEIEGKLNSDIFFINLIFVKFNTFNNQLLSCEICIFFASYSAFISLKFELIVFDITLNKLEKLASDVFLILFYLILYFWKKRKTFLVLFLIIKLMYLLIVFHFHTLIFM